MVTQPKVGMNAVAIVVSIVIAILLLTLLTTYNGLIHLRQEIRVAWAKMDEQLKQRYGLVSTFVQTAQSIGGDLEIAARAMVTAKNQAAVAFDPAQLAVAEAALTIAIQAALRLSAEIPDLATTRENLINNQERIDQACRVYNGKVDALNSAMSSFPQIITAKAIGLRLEPLFNV